MLSALRKQITPATILAFVALVFAITGGAFAASGTGGNAPAKANASSTHSTLVASASKAKPKAKAGPRGPAGAKGATGATGPAGAPGPAGATGPGGPQGAQGPAGTNGMNGTNGEKGEKGLKGTTGEKGPEGALGTAGVTLPSKASETGVFVLGETPETGGASLGKIAISFTIPLAAPLDNVSGCGTTGKPACAVHIFEGSTLPTGCTATIANGKITELKAEPGNLCIHLSAGSAHVTASELLPFDLETEEEGAGRTGTILATGVIPAEASAQGTWVVTAP
jgi:hypothetical protein